MPPASPRAEKIEDDIPGQPCAKCVKCGRLLVVPWVLVPIEDGVECADGECLPPRPRL